MPTRMLACFFTIYPLKSNFHGFQTCGSHSGKYEYYSLLEFDAI
jgi:hypothetical protein